MARELVVIELRLGAVFSHCDADPCGPMTALILTFA
jgi:hypothetical protein